MKKLILFLGIALSLAMTAVLVQSAGITGTEKALLTVVMVGLSLIASVHIPAGALRSTLTCADIDDGADINCDYPITGGTDDDLILINKGDIASVTRDGTNPTLITGITMKADKIGFMFKGQLGSLRPKFEQINLPYDIKYKHQADFLHFEPKVDKTKSLEKLGKSNVVAIFKQNYDGDATLKSKWVILGLDSGLRCQTMTRDWTKNDTQGAVEINLQSSDKALEPHMPAHYFHTDAATSETEIIELYTPAES